MIDPDDERTAFSRRKAAAPAPDDHDAVDERTHPSQRFSVGADAVDDTVVSARSAVASDSEVPTQAATESAPAGPRRTGQPPTPEPADASVGVRRAASGSRLDPEPAGETAAVRGRVAAAPAPAADAYRARAVPPATAVRAEPARRTPQEHVDTAAVEAIRGRRRRRRMIAVAAAASVLVIVVALALVVLLTTG
ncbi:MULTISPECIES: hypothetical protein [Microbacterium]|uniref:Uncharacterized protein n=1 Tax=Microbacterium trichothecenolyticum TaxID=69370 RepID=A0A0M2H850_MICTR|nr:MULTISPECIES: hypothetical protein [Microbacterium]KJL40761.1 hypothetical protein RS82_03377 [Microbacterium trichothecenolyticum]MDR7188643.1 hypothetical protein [Microbacterium sp. BE35]